MKKLLTILLIALSSNVHAQEITGAGATFPAPLYSKWASDYNKATNIKVNYQSVGSGAGLKQIESKTVTFGASDMPLTDEKLKEYLVNFEKLLISILKKELFSWRFKLFCLNKKKIERYFFNCSCIYATKI